jgi:cytochrome c oxidase assembly factor CtaG
MRDRRALVSGLVVLVGIEVAALLYAVGVFQVKGRRARRERGWRALAFYGGLAAVLLATGPPLDRLAEKLFWAHMLQHMLLQMVAPPLIVLGTPWMLLWRPLPLGLRRRLSHGVLRMPAGWPVRSAARLLAAPAVAWLLFVGAIVLSHLPAVYDYAVRHSAFHEGEHLVFLVVGVLFWSRAIDSPPFRCRLRQLPRVGFFVAAALVETLLALVILAVHTPLYSRLGTLVPAPHQLSAIEDQQLGAAIMLEPASIPLFLAIVWSIGRWLGDRAERQAATATRPSRPQN